MENNDIREAIESSINQVEGSDSQNTTPQDTTEAQSSPSERPRGPDGRFVKSESVQGPAEEPTAGPSAGDAPAKTPEKKVLEAAKGPAAQDQAKAPAEVQTKEPGAPENRPLKPPASLTPAAREHWASVHPEIQREFLRREQEIQRALQQTAGARQFTQKMTEVLNPYLPLIQGNGGDPFSFIGNLLHASNALTYGAPQFKAQVVAELVKQFGVNIEMLDAALAGLPVSGDGQQQEQLLPKVQQMLHQQLAPVHQFISQIESQRRQAFESAYEKERETVERLASDPKYEFLDDVRDIMADLMEISAQRGIDLGYEEAYEQACRLHPEVKRVIVSRNSAHQQQSQAAKMTEAAQRAKTAAVSVSGAPAVGVPKAPEAPTGDLRASIEAAISALSG